MSVIILKSALFDQSDHFLFYTWIKTNEHGIWPRWTICVCISTNKSLFPAFKKKTRNNHIAHTISPILILFVWADHLYQNNRTRLKSTKINIVPRYFAGKTVFYIQIVTSIWNGFLNDENSSGRDSMHTALHSAQMHKHTQIFVSLPPKLIYLSSVELFQCNRINEQENNIPRSVRAVATYPMGMQSSTCRFFKNQYRDSCKCARFLCDTFGLLILLATQTIQTAINITTQLTYRKQLFTAAHEFFILRFMLTLFVAPLDLSMIPISNCVFMTIKRIQPINIELCNVEWTWLALTAFVTACHWHISFGHAICLMLIWPH